MTRALPHKGLFRASVSEVPVYAGVDLSTMSRPAARKAPVRSDDPVAFARMRLTITLAVFAMAFLTVGLRLVDLMAVQGPAGARIASADVATTDGSAQPLPPGARADIVDRNGVLLATNLPTVNLYADASLVFEPEEAAAQLATIFPDADTLSLFEKLASSQRFVYLRRNLTPKEQAAVMRLGIPGLDFEDAERRAYPQGALFSHLLGATDPDNVGSAGLELGLNAQLSDPAQPARLSLDVRVQQIVREELATAIKTFNATGGAAMVVDARTSEIVALTSLPDYQPAHLGTAPAKARFNRATLGTYEMGSVFKLFNAAMALEGGTAALESRYDASHPLKVARYTITDFHAKDRWLSVPEILVYSSNIGSAQMALEAGSASQQAFLGKLGLLTPLSLEIPETGTPQYPSPWREINTVTISYGHGISVTPVQVANAVAALVNGGTFRQPTLLADHGGEPLYAPANVISPATSAQMRALMRLVVTAGSGKQANVPGYRVGGKTGSAEMVSSSGGYATDRLRTSFVGAFPMDDPAYVVLTMLEEPKGTRATFNFATAGWNAAPTTGRIIARMAPLVGITPKDDPAAERDMPRMAHVRAQMVSVDADGAFPGGTGEIE